jgi:hypothetical protein
MRLLYDLLIFFLKGDSMKQTLKCKTPAKAQVNFRKNQRTEMNRTERRRNKALVYDANREMFGDDADYFEASGIDDIGCK